MSTRDNAIVNRLNKTKVEKEVDHEAERQERLRAEGRKKKAEAIERVSVSSALLTAATSRRGAKEEMGRRQSRQVIRRHVFQRSHRERQARLE